MSTFARQVVDFLMNLQYTGELPDGISIMNPFRDNPEVIKIVTSFYSKYYNDYDYRHLILGINPGRHGAGVTGIPFTDTIRLKEKCGFDLKDIRTFETSSVFIYEMIDRYGGPEDFYRDFFISSVSPLGFTSRSRNGREINYNYYDSKELSDTLTGFIVRAIKTQINFGIKTDVCFCLGSGKNYRFLMELNDRLKLFRRIVPLEHPRFIMQYRSGQKDDYIQLYLNKFSERDI